jgi:hypothetical protein
MTLEISAAIQRLKPDVPYTYSLDEGVLTIAMEDGSDLTQSEVEADIAANGGFVELRMVRDSLLAQSDWTQIADVALDNAAAWRTYRQALRDLPANTSDPENPTWPNKPG